MKKIMINILIIVVSIVAVACTGEKKPKIANENIATSSFIESDSDVIGISSSNLKETHYRLKKISGKYARFHDVRFVDNNLYLAGNGFSNDFSEKLISVIDIETDKIVPVCKYEVDSDIYIYDALYNIYEIDECVYIDKTNLLNGVSENVFCAELNMDIQYFYVCGTRKYIYGFDGKNFVINVYDADYNCIKTLLFSRNEIVKNLCCDNEGNTYVFLYSEDSDENVLYKYDNQLKECYSNSYNDMSGFPMCAFKEENADNVVLVTFDNEKIFINTIDSQNGKTIERYEYMPDDLQEIYPGAIGYEMIFVTVDGVYGYNYSSNELEMICEHDNEKIPIGMTVDGKVVISETVESISTEESDGVIKSDCDGNIIDKMPYIKNQNGFISQAYITKTGAVYYIEEKYNPMYIEDDAQAIHIVHYIDFSGEYSCYEVPSESIESYPLFIVADSDKNVVVAETNDYEMILNIYDNSGKLINKVNKPGFCGLNLYFMSEDKLYIGISENGEENNFYSFDFNSSKLTLIEEISEGGSGCADDNIDNIYLYSSDGINKYSFESKELSNIVNQVELELEDDLSVNRNIVDMTSIGNDEFVVSLYTEGEGVQCYKIEKFEAEYVPTITIGAFCFNREMLGHITKFNEENHDCRIVTKSYDSGEFINEMHMDLIQNKLDIIISDTALSVNDYDRDMFCDLSEFFENDENIIVSDYYENIIELYKENGIMYRISPSFTVSALLGRADDINQNEVFGWNVKQFLEYAKKYNVIGESERTVVMRKFIPYFADNYIDRQCYTCDFLNTDFKDIMPIIKGKVENLEYGGYVSTSELLDKTVDLVMTDISSDANSYSIFNDTDIVFKGYPSENKNGFVVNPSVCFSITSNCQNKEIAWRFIRYFLLDEYQSSIKNGIPLKKSYKDNIFVDATQTYYGVIDEKVSSEIKKKVVEVIENADVLNCVEMNDRIYKIIEEETSLYFDNQIDVDQMSQSIQSKVSLYLNEIK